MTRMCAEVEMGNCPKSTVVAAEQPIVLCHARNCLVKKSLKLPHRLFTKLEHRGKIPWIKKKCSFSTKDRFALFSIALPPSRSSPANPVTGRPRHSVAVPVICRELGIGNSDGMERICRGRRHDTRRSESPPWRIFLTRNSDRTSLVLASMQPLSLSRMYICPDLSTILTVAPTMNTASADEMTSSSHYVSD